jgi:UDP-2,3-diacylglucosamine pyrophosphatase LpxH
MSATGLDGAVVRKRLPDETLLVFLSDVHIGGAGGSDIFESANELRALIDELRDHAGPVELILAGDFLDVLRLAGTASPTAGDEVAATLARPVYRELFASLRRFATTPGKRVVYLPGNHDAEVWSNPGIRRALEAAGFIDRFALSFAASFESFPEQLIYCEHGNQFDPANAFTDYGNPLDTPLGSHIVTDAVRPVGTGVAITERIDLRDVSFVFPLMSIPEWIAGRIFYQVLSRLLRWVVAPLVAVFVVYQLIATALWGFDDASRTGWAILGEVAYAVALVVVVFAFFFLLSRRATENAGRFWFKDRLGPVARDRHGRAERARSERAIREALDADHPLPLGGTVAGREVAVFVSGHSHAPALSTVTRPDGTAAVVANTGCWLRQLQPVKPWLDAPPVYVPVFVRTHVRVRAGDGSITVDLWNHPSPAEWKLPWMERAAIAGRGPSRPSVDTGPVLVSRQTVDVRLTPREPTHRRVD